MLKKFYCFFIALLCGLTLSAQYARYLGPMEGMNHKQHGFAYQGMDIYGDYMVSCQNQGAATIYKLSKDKFTKVSQFKLATFNEVNHANVASFGVEKADKGDPMPVLYVSQCHKKPYDGRKDLLFVERIMPDLQSSALMQTIFYDDINKDFGYALQWVIDTKNKMLYGYGNTVNNDDPANRHRIIKFPLPMLSSGAEVVLKPEDALENYLIEEVSEFRFNPIGQGLYIQNDKLYMPTGIGTDAHPSILYVWDLKKKSMETVDLTQSTSGELEDISCYNGKLYVQGQDGIFVLSNKIPFKISSAFSDNMVLQRNAKVPIWGWAKPGTSVKVTTYWNEKSYSAKADKSGYWKVYLPTPEAGGPYDIQVNAGSEERILTNVLIGEVWIFAGQSNMDMPVKGFRMQKTEGTLDEVMASARYADKVRILQVKRPATVTPMLDLPLCAWVKGSGENAANCSAVAWYFAKNLSDQLNVPVGVIENAWGGCSIEPYMTEEYVVNALTDNVPEEKLRAVLERQNVKKKGPKQVATIWNSRMLPIAGYAAKGFIWYQGESNKFDRYYDLMQTAMVKQWRKAWGDADNQMPFMFTTIAPHKYEGSQATTRAFFVENQLRSLKFIPNAYAAITESIGDEQCIHPAKKKEVAYQFLLLAMDKVYQQPVLPSGYAYPVSYEFKDSVVTVRFDNVAMGLGSVSKKGRVKGFELAGENQVFYPAKAKVEEKGTVIKVQCPQVPAPKAVRYNFHNYSDGNLENTFGIPVPCFRSDNWAEK